MVKTLTGDAVHLFLQISKQIQMTADAYPHFFCQTKALNGRLGRLDGFARYGDDLELQAASMRKLVDEVRYVGGRVLGKLVAKEEVTNLIMVRTKNCVH